MSQIYDVAWSVPRKVVEKNELIQIDHYFFAVPIGNKYRTSDMVEWMTEQFGHHGFYTNFDHDRKGLFVGFKTYGDAFMFLLRFSG